MTGQTYRIRRIGDLLALPEDRIGPCLAELAEHLRAMRRVGRQPRDLPLIDWTDDGDSSVTARWYGSPMDAAAARARMGSATEYAGVAATPCRRRWGDCAPDVVCGVCGLRADAHRRTGP